MSIKESAKQIISDGLLKIIKNYTEIALLINACDISKNRYKKMEQEIALSTTQNIPSELRLDLEFDVKFSKEELVREYENKLIENICENYIISSISITDAILEDLYNLFLKYYDNSLSDTNIENKVRSAWANENMINFLTNEDKVNLKTPSGYETGIIESFYRYSELRIMRHSLVHTSGKISDRNINKLKSYYEQTPDERKSSSLYNSFLYDADNEIILNINNILLIRKYLDNFLMYIYKGIDEKTF